MDGIELQRQLAFARDIVLNPEIVMFHGGVSETVVIALRPLALLALELSRRLEQATKEPTFVKVSTTEHWVRIGRWCSTKRRSLWLRLIVDQSALTDLERADGCFIATAENVIAIEFRAGREGDDFCWRCERTETVFHQVLDLTLTQLFAIDLARAEGPSAVKHAELELREAIAAATDQHIPLAAARKALSWIEAALSEGPELLG